MKKHRQRIMERMQLRHDACAVDALSHLARSRSRGRLIGVHIRQGDFRSFAGGSMFVSTSDYAKAMQAVAAALDSNVSFLVCSNEPKTREEFPELVVTIASGTSPTDDLTLLSRCDGIIGSHSTFAAWASLAGNIPILPLENGMYPEAIREAARRFI
ncbi:alpha-1,2-fucosyltransferase [Tardiphaga sp. 604_B6_N1_1]|uniref:alpha-1,2-fucosyltransferase n=1 Tax=Tardiphaga sp. 604_B6_N1_1 TaxID=3240779 RepID=UPI003F1F896B